MATNSHSLDLELSSSQYVSITNGDQTNLNATGDFSFECWYNLEQLPSTPNKQFALFNKWSTSVGNQSYLCQLSNSTDKLQILYSGDGTNTTSMVSDDALFVAGDVGKWVHIALAVDVSAKTFELWKDTVSKNTTTSSGTQTSVYDGNAPFQVSNFDTDDYIDGKINNMRFWNKKITGVEVAANWKTVLTTETGLISTWYANDNHNDLTATGNDLTASGSPTFSTDIPFIYPTGAGPALLMGLI